VGFSHDLTAHCQLRPVQGYGLQCHTSYVATNIRAHLEARIGMFALDGLYSERRRKAGNERWYSALSLKRLKLSEPICISRVWKAKSSPRPGCFVMVGLSPLEYASHDVRTKQQVFLRSSRVDHTHRSVDARLIASILTALLAYLVC